MLDCKDVAGAACEEMEPSEPTEVVPTIKIDEPQEHVLFFDARFQCIGLNHSLIPGSSEGPEGSLPYSQEGVLRTISWCYEGMHYNIKGSVAIC